MAAQILTAAFNRDLAAVHLYETLDQRQSDTETGRHGFGATIDLCEHFEDKFALVRRYANAAVGDRYNYIAALPFRGYLDQPLGRREFGSVVEQVGENLSQPVGVGVQQDWMLRQFHDEP